MSVPTTNSPANCTTVQIIEPNNDLIVDTGSVSSDVDESGFVALSTGQTSAQVTFQVPKISGDYHFEYLYITAPGVINPGSITIVPVSQTINGFTVTFAGAPVANENYILYWRVVVRVTTPIPLIDFPEDLYLQMPRANLMVVSFINQRSDTNYGFSELRVENLHDAPAVQAIIHVQVYEKTTTGFLLAVNPTPPTNFYFLRVRTP